MIKLLALLLGLIIPSMGTSAATSIIGAFWPNWGIYKNYQMSQIPVDKLNTVYYAFMGISSRGTIVSMDSWSDINKGNLNNFAKLSVKNRVLAIGGGGYSATKWNYAFNNPQKFADSIQAYITKYNINGIDLDYEPGGPVSNTIKPKLVGLFEVIRAKYPKILLQWDIPANHYNINNFGKTYWARLAKANVYINVMAYDMYTPGWWPKTALQSPLMAGMYIYTGDSAIQALRANLVPSELIILGVPFYCQTYNDATNFNQATHASYTTIDYKDLIPFNSSFTEVYQGNIINGTYTYLVSKRLFVTYNSIEAMRAKAQYVKDQGIGGIAAWEISQDLPATDTRSLIKVIFDVLGE